MKPETPKGYPNIDALVCFVKGKETQLPSETEFKMALSNREAALAKSYAISIVIPAHNAVPEIRLCLEALFQNDLANTEILVVDDSSTDGTSLVISTFPEVSGVPTRSLKRDERGGPAAARNEGLRYAQNPYVLFVDADVVLPEQSVYWIRETLDLYSHLPEIAGVLGVYSETPPWEDFLSDFKNLYTCFLYKITETRSPFLHTPIFCIKKDLLEMAGGFDSELHTVEDFRLGLALGSQGYRFIIDRRIQGRHLKRYSLDGIFREDWRRIRDLWTVAISAEGKKYYYRGLRWLRLISVLLPGPVVIFGGLAFLDIGFAASALFLLLVFYLCNLPFLRYCRRLRGGIFVLKAAGFLFVEMLWAEISLMFSVL